jgi:hypothetical protein
MLTCAPPSYTAESENDIFTLGGDVTVPFYIPFFPSVSFRQTRPLPSKATKAQVFRSGLK